MIFGRKFSEEMEHLREDKAKRTKDETEDKQLKDGMEKGDLFAMIVSALLVFVPVALAVLLVIAGVGFLFFWR